MDRPGTSEDGGIVEVDRNRSRFLDGHRENSSVAMRHPRVTDGKNSKEKAGA
jgi:hypothetical protein